MQIGCSTYAFMMTWGIGVMFTLGGLIVQPRDQAPTFYAIGIIGLVLAAIWTYYRVTAPKREAEKKRLEKLQEQRKQAFEEKSLAEKRGLEKYYTMDVEDARRYKQGVEAMRQLGVMMQNSVYQEKEKDWAVLGGIADGLAGPVAGIATAANAMQDNVRIRAENEERRQWGARQNLFMQDLANQAERKSPTALSMAELERRYSADMTWLPDTLLSFITVKNKTEIDEVTGAVTVSADWTQDDKTICIDGALRAKLYTEDQKCAGCAYLVLPKNGTSKLKGTITGICAEPKASKSYTVKIEPVDLWEFKLKGNKSSRETDNISVEKHKKIVSDYQSSYLRELNE